MKKDIVKLYREISGQSYMIVFEDVIKRYYARDYEHRAPLRDAYMPCETVPVDRAGDLIDRCSEYVGDLIILSDYDRRGIYKKIDFIIIHIANRSYRLEKYMEDIINELSGHHYFVQTLPSIRLGYMGVHMNPSEL